MTPYLPPWSWFQLVPSTEAISSSIVAPASSQVVTEQIHYGDEESTNIEEDEKVMAVYYSSSWCGSSKQTARILLTLTGIIIHACMPSNLLLRRRIIVLTVQSVQRLVYTWPGHSDSLMSRTIIQCGGDYYICQNWNPSAAASWIVWLIIYLHLPLSHYIYQVKWRKRSISIPNSCRSKGKQLLPLLLVLCYFDIF